MSSLLAILQLSASAGGNEPLHLRQLNLVVASLALWRRAKLNFAAALKRVFLFPLFFVDYEGVELGCRIGKLVVFSARIGRRVDH